VSAKGIGHHGEDIGGVAHLSTSSAVTVIPQFRAIAA
jgi:hypothetical protein